MIAPLGPIGLAGVAWYQGESDTGLPRYGDRLRALMQGWRHQAGRPDLPFAIVKISAYGATAAHPVESGWANLRDIQRRVAEAHAQDRKSVAKGKSESVRVNIVGRPFIKKNHK